MTKLKYNFSYTNTSSSSYKQKLIKKGMNPAMNMFIGLIRLTVVAPFLCPLLVLPVCLGWFWVCFAEFPIG